MESQPPLTLNDIAKRVGVSRTTVSNVLNGTGRVSPETAKRVREEVKESRFIVNATARTLRRKQSQIVAILVPVLDHMAGFQDNPFYWAFMAGLQRSMKAAGFHIMLDGITCSDEFVPTIHARNLDGVVVIGAYEAFPLTLQLAQVDSPPVVFVDSYLPSLDVNVVATDDRFGSYLATRHLLGLGHRKILFLSGTRRQNGVDHERWEGYLRALAEDPQADEPIAMETQMSLESGRVAAHRIVYEHPEATAIVATGDVLAVGLLRGFYECGVSVPQDRSVIGFDDIQIARHTIPSLTTIHQDIRGKGEQAGAMLMELMAESSPTVRRKVSLAPHLVVRESTGPRPAHLARFPGREVVDADRRRG